jgi:ABC-type branched-subunit amino acid transport system substrate-binding protein
MMFGALALSSGLLSTATATAFAAEPRIVGGLTANEIYFGRVASFTGPSSNLGKQMRLGFEAQFRSVNDAGGIHGRKIKIFEFDDVGDAKKTTEGANILIKKHDVFALLSPTGTRSSKAAIQVANDNKVPLIGPYTGDAELINTFHKGVFHVQASYLDQVQALAKHASDAGYKNVAVLFQDDIDDPKMGQAIVEALKKYNITPALVETLAKDSSDAELQAVGQKFADLKPQGVIAMGAPKPLSAVIKKTRGLNPLTNFLVVPTAGTVALARTLDEFSHGLITTQVIPLPFNMSYDLTAEYRASLDKYYPAEQATFTGVQGFVTAKIVIEALKRAGPAPTRERFVSALESMKSYDVGGFVINYSPTSHAGSKFVDLVLVGKSDKNNPKKWLGGAAFENFVD